MDTDQNETTQESPSDEVQQPTPLREAVEDAPSILPRRIELEAVPREEQDPPPPERVSKVESNED